MVDALPTMQGRCRIFQMKTTWMPYLFHVKYMDDDHCNCNDRYLIDFFQQDVDGTH